MKNHPFLYFLCLLFSFVSLSCNSEDEDVSPSLSPSGEQLYLATKITPYNPHTGGGGIKNFFLVLLPDGTAYNGLPRETVLGALTRERLIDENELRVGRYEAQGNTLTITWTFNQNKQWTLTKEDGGWRQNSSKHYQLVAPAALNPRLEGTYMYEYTSSAGFPGSTPSGTVYVQDKIQFNAAGTFVREIFAGGSADPGTASGTEVIRGQYTLEGYQLTLQAESGESVVYTAFRWPKEENTVLAIQGKRYQKQ